MNRIRRKILQFHKVYRQKRDDRGSAIVIVIIAMAMIGILATTLLWMAYMNYMIKVADVRNKNSFYSAEEVVEQIMAGLQHTSADAVGVAYRDVMANWESLGTEDNRYSTFATTYMDTLIENLKRPGQGNGYYDRDKLKAYVDTGIFVESSDTEGVNKTDWDRGGPASGGLKPAKMEMVNNNSIILHNIYVSYTDSENRVSVVQTDICIDVPKLVFENGGSIDGLYEYSLIGNSGIEVLGAGGKTTVEGSVFAGTDAVTDKGGLLVRPANTLELDNAKRVISKGDIVVEGPAAGIEVKDVAGEDIRVYAQNITLNSGTAKLDCKTYVANDLSLNGSGSKAILTKEYYGYGASAYNDLPGEREAGGKSIVDSSLSSAIIINGKNSTVDMAGVNRLLLAGRSYIGQKSTRTEAEAYREQLKAGTVEPYVPVMMGESIAVKGGQIAYLVPAECIGTRDGETVIGQNPINGEKENDIKEMLQGNGAGDADASDSAGRADVSLDEGQGGVFQEVDFTKPVYRLGGKSLSDFGVMKMEHIRKVYIPYRGGTLLYYYLVMDKRNAERYFVQYYDFNANRESIDRYFNTYASGGILLGDFEAPENQYTILGNSLVSRVTSASGVGLLTSVDQTTLNPDAEGDGSGTPEEGGDAAQNPPADPGIYTETGENAEEIMNQRAEADVLKVSREIADTYKALTFNLTEDASMVPTDPEMAKNYYVFNSVIKEKEVEKYLDDHHTNQVIYETDDGLRAVLTRNAETSVSALGDQTRLIISYGDVKVDRNFTGLIIAKGKITVNPSTVVSIKQNKMDLYKVLEARNIDDTSDTKIPINMFVNGSGSMADDAGSGGTGGSVGGAGDATVDEAGNLIIDYGEIVRYMNWIKK